MSARSTVYISEDAVIVVNDPVGGILAIRQQGRLEVWSDDGETHMGNLPIYATETEIRKAAECYVNGYTEGIKAGRDEARAKLRAALELNSNG